MNKHTHILKFEIKISDNRITNVRVPSNYGETSNYISLKHNHRLITAGKEIELIIYDNKITNVDVPNGTYELITDMNISPKFIKCNS